MLALQILGFLYGEPLHGYELRARIGRLTGHVRPVSDGALYPAIARLESAGLLRRREEAGSGPAPRQVLSITDAGREELLRRLREPKDSEISDQMRFFTLLTFLSALPSREDRARVLRRRLDFLEEPSSFFYRDGAPLRAEDVEDPYRRGILLIARAAGKAERAWLRETIADLES
ncbi:PadR family transcriptional regulator [Bailinhaonella thermotolerans]|uniref:PadR family transcriptional regulator n=1 Tax=Bailinhaonella thermotolerans TaxID=1070861 RepID=A0A3A4AH91_9ACTN|nr:PadR family transcriptional regulator [Bailinhaonella thermotolerans]RJL25063.1 PadR family transcriptional regulator [Bailinhaonella thermotolerans]